MHLLRPSWYAEAVTLNTRGFYTPLHVLAYGCMQLQVAGLVAVLPAIRAASAAATAMWGVHLVHPPSKAPLVLALHAVASAAGVGDVKLPTQPPYSSHCFPCCHVYWPSPSRSSDAFHCPSGLQP